jgi:hypothetical protein
MRPNTTWPHQTSPNCQVVSLRDQPRSKFTEKLHAGRRLCASRYPDAIREDATEAWIRPWSACPPVNARGIHRTCVLSRQD